MRDVVFNDGLKHIRDHAFQRCISLRGITLPSTVIEIGVVCLNGGCSSLERITIPSTVVEIGQNVFSVCTSLRDVELNVNNGIRTTGHDVLHDAAVVNNGRVQIKYNAFRGCTSLERLKLPSLSTRLNNIIQAGQRNIEAMMDDIPTVEWRDGELIIPAIRQEIERPWGEVETEVEIDIEKLDKIVRLIKYHEIKEATTLFELALWKAGMIRQTY